MRARKRPRRVIFQCDRSDGLVGGDGGQIPDKTGYFAVEVSSDR